MGNCLRRSRLAIYNRWSRLVRALFVVRRLQRILHKGERIYISGFLGACIRASPKDYLCGDSALSQWGANKSRTMEFSFAEDHRRLQQAWRSLDGSRVFLPWETGCWSLKTLVTTELHLSRGWLKHLFCLDLTFLEFPRLRPPSGSAHRLFRWCNSLTNSHGVRNEIRNGNLRCCVGMA